MARTVSTPPTRDRNLYPPGQQAAMARAKTDPRRCPRRHHDIWPLGPHACMAAHLKKYRTPIPGPGLQPPLDRRANRPRRTDQDNFHGV